MVSRNIIIGGLQLMISFTKNVTIGLNSVIMPGCEIGDNAVIGASAVLLKNTNVEPRAVYFEFYDE